jgi:hypothetical protein
MICKMYDCVDDGLRYGEDRHDGNSGLGCHWVQMVV